MATADEQTYGRSATPEGAELEKAMTWRDGLALSISAPGSIFAALGFSIAAMGGWWSMALWGVAVVLAVLATAIYTEMAGMFPAKSGGIAMYAEEAWKPYAKVVGPLATWGYWVAWSAAGAVFAGLIGELLTAEFFSGQTWAVDLGFTELTFSKVLAVGIIVGCYLINVRGVHFLMSWGWITGGITVFVLLMMAIVPFVTGSVDLGNVTGHLGFAGSEALRVCLVWIYVMFWTTGGVELAASFTPEFKNSWRDTRKALAAVGAISLVALLLVPVATAGTIGEGAIAANPIGFVVEVFHELLPTASWIPTSLLCGVFLLVILAGDADGSRTLYGMSQDKLTLRQFGYLNKRNAPAVALTLSMVFNVFLIVVVTNSVAIIAAANLGYILAHFFAVSGFLLLRRDQPATHRPVRLNALWIPVAVVLAVVLLAAAILGSTGFSVTGYGGVKELVIGFVVLAVGILMWLARMAQDRVPAVGADGHAGGSGT